MLRCIDLETLSLDPKDGVCECAYSDVGIGPIKPKALLVNPGRPIPPEASAVHHIIDADVADNDIAATWPLAEKWLAEGSAGVYAAHNARFERSYFDPPGAEWICTYKVALSLYPEAPSHKLQVLRYWLKLDVDPALASPPHRAGPDTYVTAVLLERMLEKLSAKTMIAISSRPAILPKLHFGMYAGKPIAEVPNSYLEWMQRQPTMDEDAKATATHHLKRRVLRQRA